MDLIALITALPVERHALLRHIPNWRACRLESFRAFRFHHEGLNCLLVESGVGQKRADQAAHALLAENPQMLISFGVAGAVQAGLNIGDVVAARYACRLVQGTAGPAERLAELPTGARQAVEQALQVRGAHLRDGVAVTTRGEQVLRSGVNDLENPVLEMETAAIAAVAAQAGLPLLALRGISDNPQEPLPLDPSTVLDENECLKPGKLLGILLRQPKTLLQLRRFRRNTLLAAENAALAVIALIGALPAHWG